LCFSINLLPTRDSQEFQVVDSYTVVLAGVGTSRCSGRSAGERGGKVMLGSRYVSSRLWMAADSTYSLLSNAKWRSKNVILSAFKSTNSMMRLRQLSRLIAGTINAVDP